MSPAPAPNHSAPPALRTRGPRSRLRAGAWWGSVIVAGCVLGAGSAALVLFLGRDAGALASGPWKTNVRSGGPDADPYTRTRVALFGLLALSRKETLYYVASTDSDGAALSGACTYRVEGTDLGARWWSITAYGPDSYLLPNAAGVYSYARTTVVRRPDGHYVVRVSPDPQPENWLPVAAGKSFDLTARLYNPDPEVQAAPDRAAMPSIVKESCR